MNDYDKNMREFLKFYLINIINENQVPMLKIERKPRQPIMEKIMLSHHNDMGKMKKDIQTMFPTSTRKKDRNLNYKGNLER